MTITLDWADADHTIFHQRFIGSWTWEELHTVWEETDNIMVDVPYEVDFILDFTDGAVLPEHFLSNLRVMSTLNVGTRVGIRVVIGANNLLEQFWGVFLRAYPEAAQSFNIQIAGSLTEAYAAIAAYRAAHPREMPDE